MYSAENLYNTQPCLSCCRLFTLNTGAQLPSLAKAVHQGYDWRTCRHMSGQVNVPSQI